MQRVPMLPPRRLALIAGACLVVSALSLLGPHAPTYDPWAWLIWGRQIASGHLDTVAGPSWKPLPVIFTSLFSLVHSAWSPDLWLVVARAAGLLSLVLAFRLGRRLAGTPGGVIAILVLALENGFVSGFARGTSESVLVALWLVAIEWHLDGAHRRAFAAAALSALLRPEVWPFVGLYGLWLMRDRQPRTVALVAGAGAAVALLWFVPEYIGSGSLLRSATRALEPVPGSPATADVPFLAVFSNSVSALPLPVYVAAAASLFTRPGRILVAVVLAYVVVVATLAQLGFTGNLRYVTLPAALLCVAAGIGCTVVIAAARRRFGRSGAVIAAAAAVAVSAPFIVDAGSQRFHQLDAVREQAAATRQLPGVVARAGGRDAVLACSPVYTGPFETQMVAWQLRVHPKNVGIFPEPPGTVLHLRLDSRSRVGEGFAHVMRRGYWTVSSSCAGRGA